MKLRSDLTHIRGLVLAFLLVGLAFVASTLYAQYAALAIDAEVDAMRGNALPSIVHLEGARTALRHLEVASDSFAESEEKPSAALRAPIARARQELDAELMAYLALPAFPGERAAYGEMPSLLRELDADIERIYALMEAGDMSGARRAADFEMRAGVERTDTGVRRLVEMNGSAASRGAERILALRSGAMRIALALDVACLALAFGAAWLSLAAVRRYTRLLKAHSDLVESRASELEVFAQRVAHDLLSPLAALSYCLAAVRRSGSLDPNVQDALARGAACVKRSTRMVDAIFEFARSGAKGSSAAHAEVSEVVNEAVEDARAANAEHPVEIRVDPIPPCAVACTPGVLTSMLANLLQNAAKFSAREGGSSAPIAIHVSELPEHVRFEIRDHGPGLSPELDPDVVFEPYVRGSDSSRPGLGLGLATVKRFAVAHGGRVGIHSAIGEGCLVWFELPKAPPADAGALASSDHAVAPALH